MSRESWWLSSRRGGEGEGSLGPCFPHITPHAKCAVSSTGGGGAGERELRPPPSSQRQDWIKAVTATMERIQKSRERVALPLLAVFVAV